MSPRPGSRSRSPQPPSRDLPGRGRERDHVGAVGPLLVVEQPGRHAAIDLNDEEVAIIGDIGINAVVPENFWEQIKLNMLNRFRAGEFTLGLSEAITAAGIQLKNHFPHQKDDLNELPDDISFDSE